MAIFVKYNLRVEDSFMGRIGAVDIEGKPVRSYQETKGLAKKLNQFFIQMEIFLKCDSPLDQRIEAFSKIREQIDDVITNCKYPFGFNGVSWSSSSNGTYESYQGDYYSTPLWEVMETYFREYEDLDYPTLTRLEREGMYWDWLLDGLQATVRDGVAVKCEGVPGGFHWEDVFFRRKIPDWELDKWEEDPSSQPEDIRKLNLLPVMRALRENK